MPKQTPLPFPGADPDGDARRPVADTEAVADAAADAALPVPPAGEPLATPDERVAAAVIAPEPLAWHDAEPLAEAADHPSTAEPRAGAGQVVPGSTLGG